MAVVNARAVTTEAPDLGVTVNPAFTLSKLRYLVWLLPSMAMATPSLAGELAEVATIGSLGLRTLAGVWEGWVTTGATRLTGSEATSRSSMN